MSLFDRIASGLQRIVLLDKQVSDLARDVEKLDVSVVSHEQRLIRIETLIEVAQNPTGPPKIG